MCRGWWWLVACRGGGGWWLVQLLWVNLIMDTMGALALATEQPTKDLLHRKPYGRHDFLITKQMWCNIIGQGIFQAIVLFFVLYRGESFFGVVSHSLEHTTIVFNTFVLCQVVNEINSRKIDHQLNVFSGILSNHVFLGILVFTLLFQYVIVEFGGSFTATTHLTSGTTRLPPYPTLPLPNKSIGQMGACVC